MTDESSAAMFSTGVDWLRQHRETYLRSGGTEGHIVDLTFSGGRPFATHCLLRYVGRRSGKVYINPLLYGVYGGAVVLVGSKGGADHHPAWYLNLTARDTAEIQIATQAFRAVWREPRGEEREKVWDFMVGLHPPFAEYQKTTARQIPVILLNTTEQIPLFSAIDYLPIPQPDWRPD